VPIIKVLPAVIKARVQASPRCEIALAESAPM
jgi:hypothetical protein